MICSAAPWHESNSSKPPLSHNLQSNPSTLCSCWWWQWRCWRTGPHPFLHVERTSCFERSYAPANRSRQSTCQLRRVRYQTCPPPWSSTNHVDWLRMDGRLFSTDDPCNNVHSQSRRMIMVSPEPNFWIHAVSHVSSIWYFHLIRSNSASRSPELWKWSMPKGSRSRRASLQIRVRRKIRRHFMNMRTVPCMIMPYTRTFSKAMNVSR